LFLLSFGAEARAGRRRRRSNARRRESAVSNGVNQAAGVNQISIGQPGQESQDLPQQDSQSVRVR